MNVHMYIMCMHIWDTHGFVYEHQHVHGIHICIWIVCTYASVWYCMCMYMYIYVYVHNTWGVNARVVRGTIFWWWDWGFSLLRFAYLPLFLHFHTMHMYWLRRKKPVCYFNKIDVWKDTTNWLILFLLCLGTHSPRSFWAQYSTQISFMEINSPPIGCGQSSSAGNWALVQNPPL